MQYHKTIFRADYLPTLGFYDNLYALARKFEGYPDWMTDRLSVTLQNFENHCSLNLTHASYVYTQDIKGKSDEDDRRIRQVITVAADSLDQKEYRRIGFRRMYLYEVEMKFENLVSLVASKFLIENEEIKAGICPLAQDMSYVVNFSENSAEIKLRAGPISRDELELHLQPDRNNNFPVRDRLMPGVEIYRDCPAVGLFVDLDYSQQHVKLADSLKVYEAALGLHEKLTRNMVRYIFGVTK